MFPVYEGRVRPWLAAEGDTVVVLHDDGDDADCRTMELAILDQNASLTRKDGKVPHVQLIGRPFGTSVMTSNGNASRMVIPCEPEQWTQLVPHRTQILYTGVISAVISRLCLRPGSVVAESGTGSGSLTHALARAVAPMGKVVSLEFNETRARLAQEEFVAHGCGSVVDCRHGNAEEPGAFGLEGTADAVFLDLPRPWVAVDNAYRALRPGGRVCTFSPCIEQTQRACLRLEELGFRNIVTFDVLDRDYKIRTVRPKQSSSSDPKQPSYSAGSKRSRDEPSSSPSPPPKHPKTSSSSSSSSSPETKSAWIQHVETLDVPAQKALSEFSVPPASLPSDLDPESLRVHPKGGSVPGHSGFLTFAIRWDNTVLTQLHEAAEPERERLRQSAKDDKKPKKKKPHKRSKDAPTQRGRGRGRGRGRR